jgi:hypothetical protein
VSEMKLIMERWDKYLVEEEEGEVTIGDFFDALNKAMPNAFQKALGGVWDKKTIAVVAGGGLSAVLGLTTGGLSTTAQVGIGALSSALLNKGIDQLTTSGGVFAKAIAKLAKDSQVSDSNRTGMANYFDIDDGYENMIGGIDSEIGEEFVKNGLYIDYLDAFEKIKKAKDRFGDDEDALKAFLALPIREVGIDRTASQLFKAMMRGEDGMSLPSMDNRKVDATPIA